MTKSREGSALAEGLYWMAEKLAWSYEDVAPNLAEAFKLFRQAADLGFSDAHIRIGQFQEHGKGTARDPKATLKSYSVAANAGNFYALAFLAKLLSRTSHLDKAEVVWGRFFAALAANPEPGFYAASPGELLHEYVSTQLSLGLDPLHRDTLKLYRLEIAGYHQQLLEHAAGNQFERLGGVLKWIELNLGPWPNRNAPLAGNS
jgi:TPR repeat protein